MTGPERMDRSRSQMKLEKKTGTHGKHVRYQTKKTGPLSHKQQEVTEGRRVKVWCYQICSLES